MTVGEYLDLVSPKTDAFWIGNNMGVDSNGHIVKRFPANIIQGIFHVSCTSTRFCYIESTADWLSFINSCYSLACRNCGDDGWMAINGEKLSFTEWMNTPSILNDTAYSIFNDQYFNNEAVICTVFDTLKQKRL